MVHTMNTERIHHLRLGMDMMCQHAFLLMAYDFNPESSVNPHMVQLYSREHLQWRPDFMSHSIRDMLLSYKDGTPGLLVGGPNRQGGDSIIDNMKAELPPAKAYVDVLHVSYCAI